jgi:hypothetical protein
MGEGGQARKNKRSHAFRESNKRVLELEARLEESLLPPPRIAGSRYENKSSIEYIKNRF